MKKFKLRIHSGGGTVHSFMGGLTEKEAIEIGDGYNWEYVDENGFCWDMDYDEDDDEEQTSSAPEEGKNEDAWRVLLQLRDAQQSILSAIWDVDDQTELEKALTIIGDKMDEISRAYGLPIMSEQ